MYEGKPKLYILRKKVCFNYDHYKYFESCKKKVEVRSVMWPMVLYYIQCVVKKQMKITIKATNSKSK